MGASVWRGTNSRRYLGRRMWRTGWGQVSGEGRTVEDILGEGCVGLDGGKCLERDEQQKIFWGKDVEDWMEASVWRVGRTAEDILGEGCGGLDGGKCLERDGQ